MKITNYINELITEAFNANPKLSYKDALKIQKEQADHYISIGFPKEAINAVIKKTKPLPSQYKDDEKLDAVIINKLVPRGGEFEFARDDYYAAHPDKKPKQR